MTVSTFWMEHVKGLARALNDNKTSAQVDLVFATLMVLGAGVGVHLGGIQGYALAVVLSPSLRPCRLGETGRAAHVLGRLSELAPGFWSYGVHTALGAVLAKGFYAVDVFLIGRLWLENAEALAVYRVAWLIPLATHVLPTAVAATDFVRNASKHDQGQEIWSTCGLLEDVWLDLRRRPGCGGLGGALVVGGVRPTICGRGGAHEGVADGSLGRICCAFLWAICSPRWAGPIGTPGPTSPCSRHGHGLHVANS